MQPEEAAPDALKKRRTFKKYSYRGVDLDHLLDMKDDALMTLLRARQRRKMQRGVKRKHQALTKKLRKARKKAAQYEKPEVTFLFYKKGRTDRHLFLPTVPDPIDPA